MLHSSLPLVVLQELLLPAVARILVVDSDPRWAGIAAALMAELRSALPGGCEQMEHIGSTSVPGLPAKPVIDLMASTADLDRIIGVEQQRLSPLGYTRFETGMIGRLCYRREAGSAPADLVACDEVVRRHRAQVAVHFHVVPAKGWAVQNERLLRDLLLADPEAARRYGDLKRRLAAEISDPRLYTRAKTELIQELVDKARQQRGLPPVNVWED
jgi:GrpB-like predicted nucleotidyltransferase (UPF0157 family)